MGRIYDFEKFEPRGVLTWFKRICAIPHGSGYERPLCDMLAKELEKAGCSVKRFKTGAILAYKKATRGLEKATCTLLQAHTDMVLAKDEGIKLDLTKQPITPYYDVEREWLKAEGTTLGADNGIGVAMIMEVMTNPKIQHGPIECLLTTGEETDATVCLGTIPPGIFKSTQIINLDTEKDTNLFYASACFNKFVVNKQLTYVPVKKGTKTYSICFKNFTGGHSGVEIHNNHINAIIFLMDALREFGKAHPICLVGLNGGIAANAIPPHIDCDIQMEPKALNILREYLTKKLDTALVISQNYDSHVTWQLTETTQSKKCISQAQSTELIAMMSIIPNGTFNRSIPGSCMYNSSNLGKAVITDEKLTLEVSCRSFVEEDAISIRCRIIEIIKHFGITENEIERKVGCRGWLVRDPDKSPLIQLWKKNFEKVYGHKPNMMVCPGGLEIAEIITKAPKMNYNSLAVGPTIWGPHTTSESCPISAIKKTFEILILTLKGMK